MSWWTTTRSCLLPPRTTRPGGRLMLTRGPAVAGAAAIVLSGLLGVGALAAPPPPPSAGETLYRHGLLSSAQPVQATREAGATLNGADAACVNCHRRSGLGSIEGQIAIPPIAGPYLFI